MELDTNENVRSHVPLTYDYQYKFRATLMPGLSGLASSEFWRSLDTRFPELDNADRHEVQARYLAYRLQADKLAEEADVLETEHSWDCFDELQSKPLIDETHPEIDQKARSRLNHIKTLRDMRAICMTKILTYETGDMAQIRQVFLTDHADVIAVRELYERDIIMQKDLFDVWTHLTSDGEKLLRLRLLWLLVKIEDSKEDADGLADGLGAMEIEQGDKTQEDIDLDNAFAKAADELDMEKMLRRMKL